MEILDAQVHVLPRADTVQAADTEDGLDHGTVRRVTIEEMLAAMEAAGIDGALATSSAMFGFDNGYTMEAARRHPAKFGVVGVADPDRPDLDDYFSRWRSELGMHAARIVLPTDDQRRMWLAGRFDRLLAAAERHDVPVCVNPWGFLRELAPRIAAFPDLQFVIDQLGLPQPTLGIQRDDPPFKRSADVVELARLPNVALKMTAVPTLSLEAFPFVDLWPPLLTILSAFGVERVMWASDWTRVSTYSYEQGMEYVRGTPELSATEKELVLGANLRRIFRWSPLLTSDRSVRPPLRRNTQRVALRELDSRRRG